MMQYDSSTGLDSDGYASIIIYFDTDDYTLQDQSNGGTFGYEYCFRAFFQDCCGE